MRRTVHCLTVITATCLAAVGAGAPAARSAPIEEKSKIQSTLYIPGNIVNIYSGRCLDAMLEQITSKVTKVQLWDCNGPEQRNQRWTLAWDHVRNAYQIKSRYDDRCLGVAWNDIDTNGAQVQLESCEGAKQSSQHWKIQQGMQEGIFTIRNTFNGKCLDAQFQSVRNNGTRMQLWDCLTGTQYNQLWRIH